MNKYNTLYGDLLSLVERSQFAKLVKEIQSDTYCKGFTTCPQFATMGYAQIAASSL